jgi:hypothetical protein
MSTDDDTFEWLGIPTPLEMYKHQCLLLENELQELNLQLRKAQADVFCIRQRFWKHRPRTVSSQGICVSVGPAAVKAMR